MIDDDHRKFEKTEKAIEALKNVLSRETISITDKMEIIPQPLPKNTINTSSIFF